MIGQAILQKLVSTSTEISVNSRQDKGQNEWGFSMFKVMVKQFIVITVLAQPGSLPYEI